MAHDGIRLAPASPEKYAQFIAKLKFRLSPPIRLRFIENDTPDEEKWMRQEPKPEAD
jgi:hypothetical protein